MYDEALEQFNASLRMNPSNAAMIYNHRARVYQYQNQMELASDEIEKGLTLEPRQPLLRISLGYQQMRTGDLPKAIETLEKVIRDDTSLRIVFPTIALCYVQLGEREKAATFIVDETLSAAEADSEMAYRLATYFALEGDESEALHWLRRAIYLGNENYPWFSKNPSLAQAKGPRGLRTHPRRPEEELPPQSEKLEAAAGTGSRPKQAAGSDLPRPRRRVSLDDRSRRARHALALALNDKRPRDKLPARPNKIIVVTA